MRSEKILIVGGGLVGSLMSIFLAKRGWAVTVFEKRDDPRKKTGYEGRSINLALSDRGLFALEKAGLSDSLQNVMVPMHGRMIHHVNSPTQFQPYGKSNQAINSVSRSLLNELLISEAEEVGVVFRFNQKCEAIDIAATRATFSSDGKCIEESADLIIGADGAFSTLRTTMQRLDRFSYSQEYIDHGYKELCIAAGKDGDYQLDPHALHIWPKGQFMLIALPNTDKSFTCTLFLPFQGPHSFDSLNSPAQVSAFFNEMFPEISTLIPDLPGQFFANPTSSLVTVHCQPWSKNRCLLIGDAAHAIVPFYGQGMNAGFEDCRLLDELLSNHGAPWEALLSEFGMGRKKDTDAIAKLAIENFIEMRDKVTDPGFLWQKKLEAILHDKYPLRWVPLYTMVTFSHLPYHQALLAGQKQESIMRKIREVYPMSTPPEAIDLEKIVEMLDRN